MNLYLVLRKHCTRISNQTSTTRSASLGENC
jgi:hypothetical protein